MKQAVTNQDVRYREFTNINFVKGTVSMRRTAVSTLTLACGHKVTRGGARPFKTATCHECQATRKQP